MVWSRILVDRAQHGAEQSYNCAQLGPESLSALKSYCSRHFQRLESTSTATHAGNSVTSLNSQTLFAEEHLPFHQFLSNLFQSSKQRSTFAPYPTYPGSLLCKMPDTPVDVPAALLYTTTQKKHYFHSCKGEEM